jgi:hypothetical protein
MRSIEPGAHAPETDPATVARRHRVEEPAAPATFSALERAQRGAGNQAVARWAASQRQLQREMTIATSGRKVKVFVASSGKLIKATVVGDFDVDDDSYNGFVTVSLDLEFDGQTYKVPKNKSDVGQIIGIDPSFLYDESVADATILEEHQAGDDDGGGGGGDDDDLELFFGTSADSESSSSEEDEPTPQKSVTGGQKEKAEREIKNKLASQKLLATSLDQVATGKTYKDGEHVVNGFTIVKKGKELMIVLFRKMTAGEAKAMKTTKGISRKEHTDPYKWFSESGSHSEGSSVGGGGGVVYKVYIDADDYLAMRKIVKPEHGATEAPENRFHQENLGATSMQVNFGVHAEQEADFNKAVKKIEEQRKK